jgi:hypothetical protein
MSPPTVIVTRSHDESHGAGVLTLKYMPYGHV